MLPNRYKKFRFVWIQIHVSETLISNQSFFGFQMHVSKTVIFQVDFRFNQINRRQKTEGNRFIFNFENQIFRLIRNAKN